MVALAETVLEAGEPLRCIALMQDMGDGAALPGVCLAQRALPGGAGHCGGRGGCRFGRRLAAEATSSRVAPV
jgi:hypothetical protein